MELTTATGPLFERVLDGTFEIWSEGLSRPAFSRWNRGQMETPWGRRHLRRVALMRDDEIVSSAKCYEFVARAAGMQMRVLGIGALFTPPPHRGRGHARALLERVMAGAAGDGCSLALLFSEIGAEFYESVGFQVVPRDVLEIEPIIRKGGAPAVPMRSAEAGDLPFIAEISETYARAAGFALRRPPDLIAFSVARRRLLAGLDRPGRRHVEFFVIEEGHRPVAYVLVTHGPAGAFLEECGDRDPSGARIGAMLQAMAARTPAETPPIMRAWLPESLRPPQIRIRDRLAAAEVMMVKALSPGAALPAVEPVVFWQSDVF